MNVRDVVTSPLKAVQGIVMQFSSYWKTIGNNETNFGEAATTAAYPYPPLSLDKTRVALKTASRQEALLIATEELEILADLLEAYFVEDQDEHMQRQAILLCRRLADKMIKHNARRSAHFAIDIDFEQLSRTLLTLKQHKLKTDRGSLWADIMRPSARTVGMAIHRYLDCVGNDDDNGLVSAGNSQLNITYTALQRRIYLTEH